MSNEHNKALCPCTKAGQCAGVTAALQCRSDINVEYAKESPGYVETEVEAPLECMYCSATGPMYPIDADHAGWMCDECYQKMQNETENEG